MQKSYLNKLMAFGIIIIKINFIIAQKTYTIEDYIDKYNKIAIKEMNLYGIPASITLAQGILESSNGNSLLAIEANNHFGIKCHKEWTGPVFHKDDNERQECFRKYSNAEQSFKDHSEFLKTRDRYSFLFKLDITDYKAWAKGLKKAGYATNPDYPQLLINLIEKYKLYQFDNNTYIKSNNNNTNNNNKDKRDIKLNNNTPYIVVKNGDNLKSIADELNMMKWQLLKYNDLGDNENIKTGDILYIKPKRRKCDKDFHIVLQGETLHSISQKYGIKLKFIKKRNKNFVDIGLKTNDKVLLK